MYHFCLSKDFEILLSSTWWCHQMETFSASLDLCVGNSPVIGEFLSQRSVMQCFDVSFDLRPCKGLCKQSRRRWFEMPSRSLWCHCNEQFKEHLLPSHPPTNPSTHTHTLSFFPFIKLTCSLVTPYDIRDSGRSRYQSTSHVRNLYKFQITAMDNDLKQPHNKCTVKHLVKHTPNPKT